MSTKAKRVLQAQKRVNVDTPTWMIDPLDREASKPAAVLSQTVCRNPYKPAKARRRR